MITANFFDSGGLVLDIVGAFVLWRYGLPKPISRSGSIYPIAEQTDDSEIAKAVRFDKLAGTGIALLMLGFFLQLVGNHVPVAT